MTHLAKALKFGIRGRLPIRNTYKSTGKIDRSPHGG